MDTPYSLLVLDEVVSTQDVARERARGERPSVVISHRQSGGRGRGGSGWETAPRAVAVSVGMVSDWPPPRWSLIPLVAAVAARRVLGVRVGLKWPNDLLVGDDKVGGILVEGSDRTVVAGLGLNLYWPEPIPGAAGLYDTDPGPEKGPRLAKEWAGEVLALMGSGAESWPREEYRDACVTLGEEIAWEPDGQGRAEDVGPDGRLEAITAGGERVSLSAGRVRHVRAV